MFIISVLVSCGGGGLPVNMQTVAHGQQLYEANCSNCHQADGKGLAKLIPPLLDADYLTQNRLILPCIIREGMSAPITVNGIMYQQKMPAHHKLSVDEITALVNFVEFRYAKSSSLLSKDSVALLLNACSAGVGQ